jgi:hypothetical protein
MLMWGGEHDEAISIYALQMRARRLLRRHFPPHLPPTLTPRNDNSEVFQHSPCGGLTEAELQCSNDPQQAVGYLLKK